MSKRAGVVVWLVITISLFVAPIQGPGITIYSDSRSDGSVREVFIHLYGLLALVSLLAGIAVLSVAWARGRRA